MMTCMGTLKMAIPIPVVSMIAVKTTSTMGQVMMQVTWSKPEMSQLGSLRACMQTRLLNLSRFSLVYR